MAYYRHYIEKSKGSSGFVFSELDADDLKKELDNERSQYCKGYTSADRPMIWHFPIFSHEITKEDFELRKEYTDPIKQIIYRPMNFQ